MANESEEVDKLYGKPLGRRELEVMARLALGCQVWHVSVFLMMKEKTVKGLVNRSKRKLGIKSMEDAAWKVWTSGLIFGDLRDEARIDAKDRWALNRLQKRWNLRGAQ